MIWSVIPEEQIWLSSVTAVPQCEQVQGRCRLLLRNGRIERLLSTDPLDYLDPQYAIGGCRPE